MGRGVAEPVDTGGRGRPAPVAPAGAQPPGGGSSPAARHRIVQPEQVRVQTAYFWRAWAPRLGAQLTVLIVQLRNMCYYNPATGERRDWCFPSQQTLARACGVSRATLQRLLADPRLASFVRSEPRYRYDERLGRKVRASNVYHVRLDDPLTPEDAAALAGVRAAASPSPVGDVSGGPSPGGPSPVPAPQLEWQQGPPAPHIAAHIAAASCGAYSCFTLRREEVLRSNTVKNTTTGPGGAPSRADQTGCAQASGQRERSASLRADQTGTSTAGPAPGPGMAGRTPAAGAPARADRTAMARRSRPGEGLAGPGHGKAPLRAPLGAAPARRGREAPAQAAQLPSTPGPGVEGRAAPARADQAPAGLAQGAAACCGPARAGQAAPAGGPAPALRPAAAGDPAAAVESDGLRRALLARGLSPGAAHELVRAYPPARIRAQLAHLDGLPRPPRNPGGWLRRAIVEGYAAPPARPPGPALRSLPGELRQEAPCRVSAQPPAGPRTCVDCGGPLDRPALPRCARCLPPPRAEPSPTPGPPAPLHRPVSGVWRGDAGPPRRPAGAPPPGRGAGPLPLGAVLAGLRTGAQ